MIRFLRRFSDDQSGATAIEYGLIAALLSIVIIGAVSALGGAVTGKFDSVATGLASAGSGSSS